MKWFIELTKKLIEVLKSKVEMDKGNFFSEYRRNLDVDKVLTQQEVNALDSFLDMYLAEKNYFTKEQWAYVFATVFHETNGTFLPVREAYWLSENWRKNNLRYYPYYGRGYVQITWESNYKKYQAIMGLPFVDKPDLVMTPENAFFILINGFKYGRFTGVKISNYINEYEKDYKGARRCINGTDKKELIARYAELFENIL